MRGHAVVSTFLARVVVTISVHTESTTATVTEARVNCELCLNRMLWSGGRTKKLSCNLAGDVACLNSLSGKACAELATGSRFKSRLGHLRLFSLSSEAPLLNTYRSTELDILVYCSLSLYVRPRKTVMPHNGSRPHSRSEWPWAYNSGACVPCFQYKYNHTTTTTVVVQYTRSERAQNNRKKKRSQSTARWSSVSSLAIEVPSVTAKSNSKTHIGTHTDSGVDQRIMTSRLHC